MNKEKYLLFIDSGAGGLSIVDYFLKIKSDVNIIYYADTLNFPYGKKEEEVIGKILFNIYLNINSKFEIPLIVIACNTASVSALEYLRERVEVPIIGTVPAVKPASEKSKNGKIGIIATETTTNGKYLAKLIKKFASDKDVFVKASPLLAEVAEKFYSKNAVKKAIEKELSSFKEKNIDTLVLGCTHYSLIKNEINDYFEDKVNILDSSQGVSKRIIQLMPDNNLIFKNKRSLILSKGDEGIIDNYKKYNNILNLFDTIEVEDMSCQKV